ncbi:hypothetical protein CVD28_09850 [Bacillus sp. M6-12]|nr:hypothetical protein CVD28_09850 [Bacillus sp. M6-12]
MVYKFIKQGDVFIHTMCEGKLLYNLGFTPGDIIGKTLHDFFPDDYAATKHQYYLKAWDGNYVHYESKIEGVYHVGSLRPVLSNGEVVEVIGSSINVTEQLPGSTHEISQTIESARPSVKRDLMIKQSNNIIFIPLMEIIFIERIGRKSVIHTTSKKFETYEALTSLCQVLDERFIGCHRSYIINMDYLEVIKLNKQSYIGYFKNYTKNAKISKNKLIELQKYKSY